MKEKTLSKKILILLALVVVFGFFFSQAHQVSGKETIEKPRVILGLSKIEMDSSMMIGAQVNRVIRSLPLNNSSFIPADRMPKNSSELVPDMEGKRIGELMDWAGVKVLPLTPARGKRGWLEALKSYGYFAADGQGQFPFLISPSKVTYPPFNKTVYMPKNGSNETADLICPDTHGFNMIAEQAYLHRKVISLAVACMDLPAKSDAALYLAQNGINIYAPCDRFANLLMNYKERFGINATILGSAPIRKTEKGAIIGDQPVTIYLDEPIAVEYTDRGYPDQYCDTPWRYFGKLSEVYDLNLSLVKVYANASEAGKVVKRAEAIKAHVIGVRVCYNEDYKPVAEWLKKDPKNRAVLLHSAAYEDGNKLFKEFPKQTTFGDLNPIIER